jgi:hypothetical protein
MNNFNLYLEKVEENLKDKEFELFLAKRKEGASKLASQTKSKGGYSKLTSIHFEAKAKPYADSLKHVNAKNRETYFKTKAREVYDKLSNLDSLSQKDFQVLMGELEVWGEVYIRSKKPSSIKLD